MGLSDKELEEWNEMKSDEYDYSYDTEKQELLSYYTKSFKHTSEIIEENQAFFNKLKGINEVSVLGHSLSDIDEPYLVAVKSAINEKEPRWLVSYYSDLEKKSHLLRLLEIGLKKNQIQFFKLERLKKTIWRFIHNYT